MENLAQTLRASADAVAMLGASAPEITALDDSALLSAQGKISDHRRHLDTYAAWVAGEIARRSHRDFGYAGLAQRTGHLSPESLIQSVSHTTRAEAAKFVRVGSMMGELAETGAEPGVGDGSSGGEGAAPGEGTRPDSRWFARLGVAVADGTLSVDAASAIRTGLGNIDETVDRELLRRACESLIEEAGSLNADELLRKARVARDELDADGIARREKELHDLRAWKVFRRANGMVRSIHDLGPEEGEFLKGIYDAATSPRRGGPRFVDAAQRAADEAIVADERSTEQIASDTLVGLLRVAVEADPGTILGKRTPAVRVTTTDEVLRERQGHGIIEGTGEAVSVPTLERLVCDAGTVGVMFDDDGQCVNVGRDQRLFTARQRVALAVRDGGCRFPGCDRPPAWTEAHHVNHWARDKGRTDIKDGMLMCRRHHMLVHNNHWEVLRDPDAEHRGYWLQPPVSIDPEQKLIAMPSKQVLVPLQTRPLNRPALEPTRA